MIDHHNSQFVNLGALGLRFLSVNSLTNYEIT